MARFKRILLKLSGESLMGKQGYGIDPERLANGLPSMHSKSRRCMRWVFRSVS